VWNWFNTHTCDFTSRRCSLLRLFVVNGGWIKCHGIMLTEECGITRGEGTFLSGALSTRNPTWTGLGSNLKDNREDLQCALFRRSQTFFPEVLRLTWSRCIRNTGCHMCPSCSYTLRIVASDRRRRISLVFWYSQSLLQQPEIMWGSFISGRISCFGAACAVCLLVTSRHKVTLAHNTKITFTYNTVVYD